MELNGEYDENNVFARILRGEIPSARIWENEHIVAFMDAFPQAPGHCLVVPKEKARNLLDASPESLARVMAATQRIARAAVDALDAEGVRIVQFNGAAAGQTVPHLHIHIIPMHSGQALGKHGGGGGSADMAALNEMARKIAARLV